MTIGKKNSTLIKEEVKESKLLTTGVKSIKFWHEALADGETSIPFGSLNMPGDISANGLINPTSTELLAANLAIFHNNVEVFSSLNSKLMEGLSYVVQNAQIKFVNGYESTEGEIFEVNYKNDVITGTNVVDARPLTATGTLTAGDVDFNVGEAFKTNAYPNDQLGEVLVFLDGEVQYRNVANATAAPSADGNYQEVQSSGGFGTIIRFNDTFGTDKPVIVISRNLIAERPDISMLQLIENLGGQLDNVIETVAILAGVDITDFQTAPNQLDLKAFGAQVLANRNNIASILTAQVPITTPWADYAPVTQGLGTPTFSIAKYKRIGDTIYLNFRITTGTVTATEAQIGLPIIDGQQLLVSSNYSAISVAGEGHRNAATNSTFSSLITPGDSFINVGTRGGSANLLNPQNGGTIFGSAEIITFLASFKIQEWDETQTLAAQLGL